MAPFEFNRIAAQVPPDASLSDESQPIDWGMLPAYTGYRLLKDSTHDERSIKEGQYSCTCGHCLRTFTGYKRSVCCEVCKVDPPKPVVAPESKLCRTDGRCQYAIESGAEGMGHCPEGKCVMSSEAEYARLGRAMYQMTTTVHSPFIPFSEQCDLIPHVWRKFMDDAKAAEPNAARYQFLKSVGWTFVEGLDAPDWDETIDAETQEQCHGQ